MTLKLKKLYSIVRDMDFEIVAGKEGMDKPVRWVHMVESIELSNFLEGQEIAFTTGIALQNQEDLLDLVKMNYENCASGMVVNIGPFIRQISPEVIKFCNENQFPLFKVPWKVHMAEIMRRFCFAITEADKKSIELNAAIKKAIFCPGQEELYLGYLEQNEYRRDWNYCISILEICDETGTTFDLDRIQPIIRRIENYISQQEWKIAVFEMDQKIVFAFTQESESEIKDKLQVILRSYSDLLGKEESCYIGVGKVTKSARCIGKSYNQAIKLEQWQKNNQKNKEISTYSEMGVYKLLMAIEDKEILVEYYKETIVPLEDYDKLNQSDCVKTLRSYLNHSGSVKDTSIELFVHRNTINYKLKKIEAILDVDLSDFIIRQKLNIGLMVGELLKL